MKRWFLLSAMGKDRPGIVADLARLIFACDANLEDSRMAILGTDFAVMMLCSTARDDAFDQLSVGVKRLERDLGMTILLRQLEGGPRHSVPMPGATLYRVRAAGEDKAGIVAGICGALAEAGVNIAELSTRSRPGPGGSPHYEMEIVAEVPERTDADALRHALDAEADRLVVDVTIERA